MVTEFPDTPFVAADGGTPDLNKVIATPTYDLAARVATVDLSVDDDVGISAAGYLDEDAFAFDVNCVLTNPTPAVGGGNQEIPLFAKVSVTRTTGTNNNGTFANVFYGDITGGWYLGVGTIADSGAAAAAGCAAGCWENAPRSGRSTHAVTSPVRLIAHIVTIRRGLSQ